MTPIEIFMTGFAFGFAAALTAWAAGFVKAIISGGLNE